LDFFAAFSGSGQELFSPSQECVMPDTPGHDPSTQDRRFEVVVEEFLREREAGRSLDPQR
jgi:hypothetical protein